jgi:hypothetical protein
MIYRRILQTGIFKRAVLISAQEEQGVRTRCLRGRYDKIIGAVLITAALRAIGLSGSMRLRSRVGTLRSPRQLDGNGM